MLAREIKKNIYSVGAIDWDRRLFDELIPLPDGTTYNSYIIKGSEKTALIDTVDPEKENELFENLESINIKKIDYIIANHAEQDHSGTINKVLEKFHDAKVVSNPKCKEYLMDLLHTDESRFQVIDDGEIISLGDKTLEFIYAPWVHWPETMLTYLKEDKILFSCDLFGSHLAIDDLYADDEIKVYSSAKRYYAEIMMPFRNMIKKHLQKLENYEIDIIAASHGPIYSKPGFIIDAYKEWVSDEVKNIVMIPYVSMHGSVKEMVRYLTDKIIEKGIEVKPYNLIVTDIGKLAMALVDTATVVFASPTVLTGAHPAAVSAAYLTNALRPKTKFISIIGSYGWGSKIVEQVKGLLSNIKAEIIEPVIIKGFPRENDLKLLDNLAEEIYKKHINIGLLK